jgi:glycosyltransferase involved in cell wall biosynthesis
MKLNEIYDFKLVLTHMDVSKEIYNVDVKNNENSMENMNLSILNNYLGMAFGVLKESLKNYDVMVGGSWDTIPETLETIIYFTTAKLRGKKFILWREDWAWQSKSVKKSIISPLIKFIVKHSDAIVVPGVKHKEYFHTMGYSNRKIFLMPNVSNMTFKEEYLDQAQKIKEDLGLYNKKIVLYVGRLITRKGVDYLIESFAKLEKELSDAVLVIVGDGDLREKLEELSHKKNIKDKVYFLGQIDNKDLPSYYLLSDICVVPSITYEMGDPWVFIINEAMEFRKPVIATDAVGAAFDMIDNGKNGFIVPEKDVNALFVSMKKILSNEKLEDEMGNRSGQIIKSSFQYQNMVEGFQSAVNYVLKKV